MKKVILGAVASFAVFAGCGVGADVEGDEVGTQRDALPTLTRSVFPMPLVPVTPTVYRSGMTLFPRTVKSAATYIAGVEGDASDFQAWGFDVESRTTVFYVRGDQRLFLDFKAALEGNMVEVPRANPTFLGSTIQGQPRIPRPIGPGGNPWNEVVTAFPY